MKLVLVLPSLGAGGAERVAATVANHLVQSGTATTLLSLDHESEASYVELCPDVQVRRLGLAGPSVGIGSAIASNLRRVKLLKTAIAAESPDCVLSAVTETNVLTLISAWGSWPVLVWEHTDPWRWQLKRAWAMMRWLLYRRAKMVIVLSHHHQKYFTRWGWNSRVRVIPNMAREPARLIERTPLVDLRGSFVLAVGRLDRCKGFYQLLDLFKQVNESHPEWSMVIVGDGQEANGLKAYAHSLQIDDAVQFTGAVKDVSLYYQRAQLFISLSTVEGFPMAVIEAMTFGLTVLVNSYSPAVKEIIDHGKNGFVVDRDNHDQLFKITDMLIQDSMLRRQVGDQARRIIQRFSETDVINQWKSLIREVA